MSNVTGRIKKVLIFAFIGWVIICSISPMYLLIRTFDFDKTTGSVKSISKYESKVDSNRLKITKKITKKTITYTYRLDSKEYENVNMYDLTAFTSVSKGDDVIVYYDKHEPQNSITYYEKKEILLKWFIELVITIIIGIIIKVRYSKISEGSINKKQ